MAEAEDEGRVDTDVGEEEDEEAEKEGAVVSDALCARMRSGSPRDLAATPWR